jgi:type IV pilus assembly protein PilE
MRARGFTLVEVMTACALAAALAAVALPSYQQSLVQARRGDAVAALGRLQAAQERHRALHGHYASELAALQLGPNSDQGFYRVALRPDGAERYRAVAEPLAGGPQADDRQCPQLVLDVAIGFAQPGPSARCWGR